MASSSSGPQPQSSRRTWAEWDGWIQTGDDARSQNDLQKKHGEEVKTEGRGQGMLSLEKGRLRGEGGEGGCADRYGVLQEDLRKESSRNHVL